jgi:hypothetical protein
MPIGANIVLAGLFAVQAMTRLLKAPPAASDSKPPRSGHRRGRKANLHRTAWMPRNQRYGASRVFVFHAPGSPHRRILHQAHHISGPGWLDTERYDLVATVSEGATKEQFNEMLQNVFPERFGLKLRHQTKDLPLHELSVAKNGTKRKPSNIDPNAPAGMPLGPPPPLSKHGFAQLPAARQVMATAMLNGRARMSAAGPPVSALIELRENPFARGPCGQDELDRLLRRQSGPRAGDKASAWPSGFAPPAPSAAPGAALPGAANDPNEPTGVLTAGLRLAKKKGSTGRRKTPFES